MKTFYKSTLTVIAFLYNAFVFAQTPIVAITVNNITASGTATYTAPGANGSSISGNTYNYTFGAATQTSYNLKDLNSFAIGSDVFSYSYSANSYVKIRRVDNSVVSGSRSLLWLENVTSSDASKIAIVNPYKENMENIFDDNTFNAGTDNIFGNQGDGNGNNNNIERLDVIFPNGLKAALNTKCGFAVFERGADNAHDPFVIAPITAIDKFGNPTAYGNILRVGSSQWGNIPNTAINYHIVRRDPATESNLRVSTSGTQNIGGVFLTLNDLGIANGTKVYGYSLIPLDLPSNATSADVVDYTNATFFPRNTSSSTSLGGLDLLAITGIFTTPNSVIFPPTAYDVTTSPVLHITTIPPFVATAVNTTIASYTVQTLPLASQGVLSLSVNGVLIPITVGQVITPAELPFLTFAPNASFTGNAVFTYSATDNNNLLSNIANYTIPVIAQQSGILAVKLLNFSASLSNKKAQLNWQTSQESGTSHFEIQKSTDGNNFEPIATITAKGNSINTYQFNDDLFMSLSNTVFYRIKMVEIDGSFKYSPVTTLKLTNAENKNSVKAWPMPFVSQLNVEYNSETNEEIKITIRNVNGAVILSSTSFVKKGNNIITINQAQSKPSGTYLLTISNGSKSETVKVIKN